MASDPISAFVLEAVRLEDVSISKSDGALIVTCTGASDEDKLIDTSPVIDAAREHGLRVRNAVGDFDAGCVRLIVIENGDDIDDRRASERNGGSG